MSPLHAKVLATVFSSNVAEYEKLFGEIKLTQCSVAELSDEG